MERKKGSTEEETKDDKEKNTLNTGEQKQERTLSVKEFLKIKNNDFPMGNYNFFEIKDEKEEEIASYTNTGGGSFRDFIGQAITDLMKKYPDCISFESLKEKGYVQEDDKKGDVDYKTKIVVNGTELFNSARNSRDLINLYRNGVKEVHKNYEKEINGYSFHYEAVVKSKTKEQTESNDNSDNKFDVKVGNLIKNAIETNSQVIFTGAPGTGKTYSVHKFLEDKESFFVQFHPSYDYTDFVEGLRPATIGGKTTFVRLDGSFKSFCRKIVEENLKNIFNDWESFSKDDKYEKLEALYTSLKTEFKKKKSLEEIDNTSNEYKFSVGSKCYYFFIDEINRADLSKVFGELMYGLEETYRGIQNRFNTQYSNLPTFEVLDDGNASELEFDCFKKGFFIPYNLKIIGTMNDIDRSVESFDFALRRRFKWEAIEANKVMKYSLLNILDKDTLAVKDEVGNVIENLCDRIKLMNAKISQNEKLGLSKDYHIGPAYFKQLSGSNVEDIIASLNEIFNKNIVSLIREYARGRKESDIKELLVACAEILGVDLND